MKIATKLGAFLGLLLAAILWAILWVSSREHLRRLAEAQEAGIVAVVERLGDHCGLWPAAEAGKRCLEAMSVALPPAGPGLLYATLLDNDRRVLTHTDALAGGRHDPPGTSSEPWTEAATREPGALAQDVVLPAGGPVRVFSAPVAREGARVGTVAAVFRRAGLSEPLERARRRSRLALALGPVAGAAAGLLIATLVTHLFLGPLTPLAGALARVSEGDLAHRLPETPDERGRLAKLFNRMVARLAEVDELKDSFVARMTHDLRSPLTAMLAHADVLLAERQGPVNEEQAKTLETILRNGYRLSEMINNLLDIAQMEAGRKSLNAGRVAVKDSVDGVLELMQARAEEYGVALSSEIGDGAAAVLADPEALRRVLTNLVSNALKFTPEGGRVRVAAERDGESWVRFAVSDTGLGIPKERLAGLFSKFYQVPETRDKLRPTGGTGLGLAICKELVELHGGRIWVESAALKSTTFYFTLPAVPS